MTLYQRVAEVLSKPHQNQAHTKGPETVIPEFYFFPNLILYYIIIIIFIIIYILYIIFYFLFFFFLYKRFFFIFGFPVSIRCRNVLCPSSS